MSAIPKPSKERSVASALPYSQHIDDYTVITHEGDLTGTIRVHGLSFETIGHKDLDNFTQQWFSAMSNIARKPNVALWTHIERRRVRYDVPRDGFDNYLSNEFARQYADRFGSERLFVNELHISPVFRLGATKADQASIRLSRKNADAMRSMTSQARDELEKVTAQLMASIKRYHPRRLGSHMVNGAYCTRVGEFYCRLLNNTERSVRLERAELSQSIQTSYLNFGQETIELEGPAGSRFAAVLTLVAPYRAESVDSKVFEGLLAAPFEFMLSQSITVMATDKAERALTAQYNRIKSTSGNADQMAEIEEAKKNLQSGRFGMFEHEFILVIYGDSIKELNNNVNDAVTILDRKSMNTSREKGGALICTYFSTLPGNFKYGRIRAMPISSRNFSCFFPMHNHPTGNPTGSQWGAPIAVMKTDANGPYFFNYHVSRNRLEEQGIQLDYDDEPRQLAAREYEEDGEDDAANDAPKKRRMRKELGNYQIIGRSGGGKTVLKLALRALSRPQPFVSDKPSTSKRRKIFTFDKDYGEEIAVRAMGGKYFRIAGGAPTGMNPFSLDPTPKNKNVILRIVKWQAEYDGGFKVLPQHEAELMKSINQVYDLPPGYRRLARLRDSLPNHEKDSLYNALHRWCDDGAFAWVLDNADDRFDMDNGDLFGFDMTNFLDIDEARTPILRYLTHKIGLKAAGSPHVIDIAEAWKALRDPLMQEFILNKGKTIRKEDGILGLDTQDPDDISKSPLGSSLLSQFPTQIILPNGVAEAVDYIDGLKLTPREFYLVKNTAEGEGRFLIKKGAESVMARLDLSGMDDMLAILSGSLDNVDVMHQCIRERGDRPEDWVPLFLKRRQ